MKPQQLVDHVAALLDKSVGGMAMFGIFRHARDGLADDETMRRMRLVVPHVRRAVLIGRAVEFRSTEVAAFADTLDGLAAGVFLLDAERRVMHTNAAGFALIAAGNMVHAADGRLSLHDIEFMQTLLDVLATGIGADCFGFAAACGRQLQGGRCPVHSFGNSGNRAACGSHRTNLEIDAHRASGFACHC